MSEWEETKLGDLIKIKSGFSYKGEFIGKGDSFLLGMGCVSFNKRFLNSGARKYSGTFSDSFTAKPGDIVLATRQQSDNLPILGLPAILPIEFKDKKVVVGTNLYRVENHSEISNDFLFWLLKSPEYQRHILASAKGTTVKMITKDAVESFRFNCPPIEVRDFISQTLSEIEDKIELNNKINQELESLAQLLFKRWFVDYEFPNENGEPYKSSGGEMVDSELGEIPKGWKVKKLNEIGYCYDNKRIPLSSMERDKRKGIFPYYGAASLMDYVDDFLFEGVYVLMGEDGSVINEAGYPVLQYVFGKFWVNNHAHVLKGNIVSTEFILCLLRNTNISDLVTGAVQPKLNQGNMNKISVALPNDLTQITSFEESLMNFYNTIRCNISEIQNLVSLRDTLLPKLISGELKINDN